VGSWVGAWIEPAQGTWDQRPEARMKKNHTCTLTMKCRSIGAYTAACMSMRSPLPSAAHMHIYAK